MRIKKIIIPVGVIAFFLIHWVICNVQSIAYIQTDISKIYDQHDITVGYFSLRSFLALYIVPLLLYNVLMLEREKDYIVVRYKKREKIWYKKIINLMVCDFLFTCFYFFVDVALMLVSYPIESIVRSHILIYLTVYFPVVFLFFSLVGIFFMALQIYFNDWKALVIVFMLFIVCYFLIELEVLHIWNPFFFLSLLSEQIQIGIVKADLIVSYFSIFCVDIFAVIVGVILYGFKEFFQSEK